MKTGIDLKAILLVTIAYFMVGVPVAIVTLLFLKSFVLGIPLVQEVTDSERNIIGYLTYLLMSAVLVTAGFIAGRMSGKAEVTNGALVGSLVLVVYACLNPLSSHVS